MRTILTCKHFIIIPFYPQVNSVIEFRVRLTHLKGFIVILTRQRNGDRVVLETVLFTFYINAHVDILFALLDVLDHEGAVSFVFIPNELGFSSVRDMYKCFIWVKHKFFFSFRVRLIFPKPLPVKLDIFSGEFRWIGERTRYGHI